MARDFAEAFGGVQVEDGPNGFVENGEEDDAEDNIVQELQAKITELEGQIDKVWNPDLKSRLGFVLEGLTEQLRERQAKDEDSIETSDDEETSEDLDELVEGDHDESDVDADDLDSDADNVNSRAVVVS